MKKFIFAIFTFLVIAATFPPWKLHAQYHGGSGVGYADSRYLGNIAGTTVEGAFSGGIGTGYAQSFRYGNLSGVEISTMFAAGSGDGYADLRYLGSINGTSLAGMFGGGYGDGYDQDFTQSFLQGVVFPIELSYFEAFPHDSQVIIKWGTESEVNHDYFTIERSKEGQFFEEIMRVQGKGGSSWVAHYEEVDPNPFTGKSWYRLKSTDLDGSFTYSRAVEVNIGSALSQSMLLFPNPYSGGELRLQLSGFESNEILQMEIIDIHGRQIYQEEIEVESADFRYPIAFTDQLPYGGYLVTISSSAGIRLSKWLIVQ